MFWLVAWQLLAWLVDRPVLLVGPIETVAALVTQIVQWTFWLTVLNSFLAIVGAFLSALVGAFLLALAANRYELLQVLARPVMLVFKSTPVACIIVVLLLWLGSERVCWAAVFLVVFPAYYFSLLEGLSQNNHDLAECLRLMGVRGVRRFLVQMWPETLPYVKATSKTVVGMSWKSGVAAELIAMALYTLGEQVYQAKLLLNTADLFAWTIVVVFMASICEWGFLRFLRWSGPGAQLAALAPAPPSMPEHADPVIAFSHVSESKGSRRMLDDVSFSVAPGETLILRGPSGSGKTTALMLMAGLEEPSEGTVTHSRTLSMVFQEARLIEDLNALQNVELVAGRDREAIVTRIFGDLLPGVDLTLPVKQLSGGQRRRVELVRALLAPGDGVLLDEPFAGLDETSHHKAQEWVYVLLKGRSLVLATHDDSDEDYFGGTVLQLGSGDSLPPLVI